MAKINLFDMSDEQVKSACALSEQFSHAAHGHQVRQAMAAAAFFLNHCLTDNFPSALQPAMLDFLTAAIGIGVRGTKTCEHCGASLVRRCPVCH